MLSRLLREHQARQSERRELQGEPAPPRLSRGLIGWAWGGGRRGSFPHWSAEPPIGVDGVGGGWW